MQGLKNLKVMDKNGRSIMAKGPKEMKAVFKALVLVTELLYIHNS